MLGVQWVGGWSEVRPWGRLGVAVGLKKRLKEGWSEELSPLAISPLPLNNQSPASSATDVCLLVTQSPAKLFVPAPSVSAISAGVSRSPAGAPRSRSDPGSTRLRHPPWPGSDPAAASPSALIKTCEMKRLARAAPFYLQHLSCC